MKIATSDPAEVRGNVLSYRLHDLPMPVEVGAEVVELLRNGLSSTDGDTRARAFCSWMLLTALSGARSYAKLAGREGLSIASLVRQVSDKLQGEFESFLRRSSLVPTPNEWADLAGRLRLLGSSVVIAACGATVTP